MANVNTFAGIYNVPAQTITGTSATPLLVPAAGVYPGVPSPALQAGAGLFIQLNPDILNNDTYDGHPFLVRLVGIVNTAVSSSFTGEVRFGTSSTAASDTSIGVTTGAITAFTGKANFMLETQLLWDSTTAELGGWFTKQYYTAAGLTFAAASASTVYNAALVNGAPPALTFIPVFTFGAAGANTVQITEFTIDRA
jgi:hypothetical protein